MNVDFVLVVGKVDKAAVGVGVGQLCGLDEHGSVAEQHEVAACCSAVEMVAPDVPRVEVLLTVRRHAAHRDIAVLTHVPLCKHST